MTNIRIRELIFLYAVIKEIDFSVITAYIIFLNYNILTTNTVAITLLMSSKTVMCATFPMSLFSCTVVVSCAGVCSCDAVTLHDTSVATSGAVDRSTNVQFGRIFCQTFRNSIFCQKDKTIESTVVFYKLLK